VPTIPSPSELTTFSVSEMFDSHVADFKRAESDAKEAVLLATTATKLEVQEKCLSEVQNLLVQAEKSVELMSAELRTTPGNKGPASNKAKQHRAELASLKRTVKDLENKVQRQRLLGGKFHEDEEERNPGGRQRLMDTSERLQEGTRRIDETRRVALETEEIGIDVMSDLRGQRDVILRTRTHMGDIDSNLEASRRTLTTMGRRVVTNKFILAAIAVCLFITLILELVMKLKRH